MTSQCHLRGSRSNRLREPVDADAVLECEDLHCDLRTAPAAEISPYGVEMMEDTAIRGH